ncbi:MAG: hypothetical protein ACPL1Z_07905 [Candidatus Bathyarchaeales archaeon]
MKTNYKKSLKLITLLLSSVLIATVSASTYYSMFMTANVGVSGANKIFFTPGVNWGSSTMGPGNQTVTLALSAPNGTITTISDPVRIYNSDNQGHNINLKLLSWNGESESNLNYINITLYNSVSDGSAQGNTIYLVPGAGDVTETTAVSIGAGTTWRVEWVVYWKPDATVSNSVTVQLELEIDKQ